MSKKKYLFSTNPLMYLTEIPVVALFFIAMYYNSLSESGTVLLPLMVFLSLVAIFILIFLFRYVSLSFEEVRTRGWFSTRDSAVVTKDKTLILTMLPKRRIKIELFGNDGQPPMYAGAFDEPSLDVYLFRAKAVGGKKAVSSVMSYYTVPLKDIVTVLQEDRFSAEYELISLSSERREDIREIRIKFKETV